MQELQTELDVQNPELDIQIIGLNEAGYDIGNPQMVDGRNLPWLQDGDDDGDGLSDVWYNEWEVEWRDVFIVNQANERVGVVNLTEYNLASDDNFQALRDILVATAQSSPLWQNQSNPLDVNNDGVVSAVGDVLSSINELNTPQIRNESFELPLPMPPYQTRLMYDVNGDDLISPVSDVLPIINYLNNSPTGAVGEGEANVSPQKVDWIQAAAALAPRRVAPSTGTLPDSPQWIGQAASADETVSPLRGAAEKASPEAGTAIPSGRPAPASKGDLFGANDLLLDALASDLFEARFGQRR